MTNYINYLYLILLLMAAGFLKFLLSRQTRGVTESVYSKKQYLVTQAEREFFQVLNQAVGNRYYIFPQVNLDKFLLIKGVERYGNRNRVDRKSVDFLLCEKNYLTPVIAIELNDSSHNTANRIVRDEFVRTTLEQAGMPLLTVPWQSTYEPASICIQIDQKINGQPLSPDR